MDIDVVATPILSGLRVEYVAVGEWTELAACTICGESGTLREVASVHAREPAASFAACVECQFIFCSRRPRSSWFESFYAASWDERGRRGIDEAHAEFSGADFCRPHLAPRARVLDIGAGLGHAALGFRDQGHDVSVTERSLHRAQRLEALGFQTFTSSIERVQTDERFDLLHIKHVLEHVDDPYRVVEACARLAADGGLVYIAVPNWAGEHALQSFHFVPHLTLFSARSLVRLLGRSGFEPLVVEADREVRVLARRTGGAGRDEARDPDFARRLEAWVARASGDGLGIRTAIWWSGTGRDQYYDSRIVGGGVGSTASAAALRLLATPRRGVSRLGSIAAPVPRGTGSVRALRFRASGGAKVPLRIRYADRAPVWLK